MPPAMLPVPSSPALRSALLALVAASALGGCTRPCLALAEKICECETTSTARDNCRQQATNQQSLTSVSSADEEVCDALLDKCDCHQTSTDEGKRNCGLAR